jgi:phage-related minor tail protein
METLMSDDTTNGGDENNVVPGPGNGKPQQQPQKAQTPESILASITGEFKQQKAKEFKSAATGVLKEVEEAKKALKLAEAKLAKLIEEFRAENA